VTKTELCLCKSPKYYKTPELHSWVVCRIKFKTIPFEFPSLLHLCTPHLQHLCKFNFAIKKGFWFRHFIEQVPCITKKGKKRSQGVSFISKTKMGEWLKNQLFVSHAIAAVGSVTVATAVTYPLDTIKVLIQVSSAFLFLVSFTFS